MASRKFQIEKGGPKRLELRWKGLWKNLELVFDGQVVGEPIPTQKELKAGRVFTLPDGSKVRVQLQTGMKTQLHVTRNGAPLPGSDSDPRQQVKIAAGIVYFIAGLNLVVGLVALSGVEFLQDLGLGWGSILSAGVMGVLGYFTSKRSKVALGLAIALFALDALFSVYLAIEAGGRVPTASIVMRVFLLIPMISGLKAMTQADDADSSDRALEAFE